MVIRREEISIEIEEITIVRACGEHAMAYCPHCGTKLDGSLERIAKNVLPEQEAATDSAIGPVLKNRETFLARTAAADCPVLPVEMKNAIEAGPDESDADIQIKSAGP